MRYLIVLFCLWVSGCTNLERNCEGHWTYTPSDWDLDDLAQLAKAEAAWNAFAGEGTLTLEAGPSDGICHLSKGSIDFAEENPTRNGSYHKGTGNVKVRNEVGEELANLLIHELGHGLGLPHIEEDGHIMSQEKRSEAFTTADLALCVEYGACR